MIPFLDVRGVNLRNEEEFVSALRRVLDAGQFIHGRECEAFESEFAAYTETEHCVGTSNGLDALRLILLAGGIGPGDEVIVPANTFIATWLAVSQCGATPVPVEPDAISFNIDPERVEAAITARTRAIIAVHLYGHPADVDPLLAICARYDLLLIEDAAQAHGARYKGRAIGALGHAAAFSFYPGKNLGALGDGGAVTTNDATLAANVRRLGNYGSRVKYHHEIAGTNARLDELQAAFLRIKLRDLDDDNRRRRAIADLYLDALPADEVQLPRVSEGTSPVWHLFVIRHRDRDVLQARLSQAGVGTATHYPVPPHLQGAYANLAMPSGSFPVTEKIHREVLSLPIGATMTDDEALGVIQAVREAMS